MCVIVKQNKNKVTLINQLKFEGVWEISCCRGASRL